MTPLRATSPLRPYHSAILFLAAAALFTLLLFPALSRSVTSSVDGVARTEITTLAYAARDSGFIHHRTLPSAADVAFAAHLLHPLYPGLTAVPSPSTSPLTLSYNLSGSGSGT